MKKLLILVLIFSNTPVNSQIDLDSLVDEVLHSGKYVKSVDQKSLLANFQRFENEYKNEFYDIYFDSTGKLSDYIGVTVVYKKIDNKGRTLKKIGYNLQGNYFLWDSSPIKIYTYLRDTTILDCYNHLNKLTDRTVTVTDSTDRIIDVIQYDKNLRFTQNEHTTFFDSKNLIVIEVIDSNGSLVPNYFGAAIEEIIFDSIENNLIKEIRFYDINKELIEAEHSHPTGKLGSSDFNPGCSYSILKFKHDNGEIIFQYYDSFGNLVCEAFMDGTITILDNN